MKVFLAGEGPDELGDRHEPPQYRASPPDVGIVEGADLARVPEDAVSLRTWLERAAAVLVVKR